MRFDVERRRFDAEVPEQRFRAPALVRWIAQSLQHGIDDFELHRGRRKELFDPADRQPAPADDVAGIGAAPAREEVEQLTGLQPGSIPPFGSLFGLPSCCDPALAENPSINFNAGDHSISVSMTCANYLAVEHPRLVGLT